MLFMEHYDGGLRKIFVGIDLVDFFVSQTSFPFASLFFLITIIDTITGHVPFCRNLEHNIGLKSYTT
jgi:hypothetical protein